jgi:hypothetical protein
MTQFDIDRNTLSEEDIWARAIAAFRDAVQQSTEHRLRIDSGEDPSDETWEEYHQFLAFVAMQLNNRRSFDIQHKELLKQVIVQWQKGITPAVGNS